MSRAGGRERGVGGAARARVEDPEYPTHPNEINELMISKQNSQ